MKKSEAYELIVHSLLADLSPSALVRHNVRLRGKSLRLRQVDVWIEAAVGPFPIRGIVDCKDYSKKVGIKHVESFIGMVEDLQANFGVLFAQEGFSEGALARATAEGPSKIRLCSALDLRSGLNPSNLQFLIRAHVTRVPRLRLKITGGSVTDLAGEQLKSIIVRADGSRTTILAEMARRWNTHSLNEKTGIHTEDLSPNWWLPTRGDDQAMISIEYEVSSGEYWNLIAPVEGKGVVDERGRVMGISEFTSEWLEIEKIQETWQTGPTPNDAVEIATLTLRDQFRSE